MTPLARLLQRKAFQRTTVTMGGTGSPLDLGNAFTRGLAGRWSHASTSEGIESDFANVVDEAYKANGVVFACILARLLPFTEARFAFQRIRNGRPGDLFGDRSLALLEQPWLNGTTGELLARMEQDASLAGNFFATVVGSGADRRIKRLRPDWVSIVSGVRGDPDASPDHVDSEVIGYVYQSPGSSARLLDPAKVVHYSPIPDPVAHWRGMSWLSTVLPEVESDSAATRHKARFFRNGALTQLAMVYDPSLTPEQISAYAEMFAAAHVGEANAYKTLHIGGGADPKTLGLDLKALDFKAVQGAGETRIAAAAGVGSIIARLSEGMQGSSLNAGNYAAAKRQFADMTLRPLWRTAAASLAKIVNVPPDARLWTDTRDVAFLAEDEKDAATILETEARTVKAFIDAGFDADAALDAVRAQDLGRLIGKHSGLFSVQLQPAGTPAAGGDI